MRLEHSLVLNRYFLDRFGARDLDGLKASLSVPPGISGDGHSFFYGALLGHATDPALRQRLGEYDLRLMAYEARLARARGSSSFRHFQYFQYLALLFTEMFLDELTADPAGLLLGLNTFLARLKTQSLHLLSFPEFTPDDLRRVAFFMATGSGKTLVMHVNLWQVLHYLEHGRHPEALVRRADERREFQNVILITPGEGLSRQHLEELEDSGVTAGLLVEQRHRRGLFGPEVGVIEIHKLAEQPSREGESIPLEELGSANLVLVDEGHKGTGSQAQTWKNRQRALSADGLLLEYSATFAQAVHAAPNRVQAGLCEEYGKAILFDYSYRHFHGDGYGKGFRVLNLERAREERAEEFLVGALLAYAQQFCLFRDRQQEYRPYLLEPPLWVFLGASVNAMFTRAGRQRSDVATVIHFLRRFVEDPDWAIRSTARILKGDSGFQEKGTHQDLFYLRLTHLHGRPPRALYREILRDIFHGTGGLEVWEIAGANGELGLRLSSAAQDADPYFGVVNIGDVSAFKSHLKEALKLAVREDTQWVGGSRKSLFDEVNAPGSRVNMVVGSKKFIEGWSSWRVSCMGLLNMGKGEGSQVIQLFGRGVRLKGKGRSLKRSEALAGQGPHPEGLGELEKLLIFGWNANYIEEFQNTIRREGVTVEIPLLTEEHFDRELQIAQRGKGGAALNGTCTFQHDPSVPLVCDMMSRIASFDGDHLGAGEAGRGVDVRFAPTGQQSLAEGERDAGALIDGGALYAALLEYKAARGLGHVYIPRERFRAALRAGTLHLPEDDARDPSILQEGALRLLRQALDGFVGQQSLREPLEPAILTPEHPVRAAHRAGYVVQASREDLLKELTDLIAQRANLRRTDPGPPLPRFYSDLCLFTPLPLDPAGVNIKGVTVLPKGLNPDEWQFVKHLTDFWRARHDLPPYNGRELHVMRNLPGVGVGFFERSNFYPDFIVWLVEPDTNAQHVIFVEPHGLHHGGLFGLNENKIAALAKLKEVSEQPDFQERGITLSGWIVTRTERQQIPGAGHKGWDEIARDLHILRQDDTGDYIRRILTP